MAHVQLDGRVIVVGVFLARESMNMSGALLIAVVDDPGFLLPLKFFHVRLRTDMVCPAQSRWRERPRQRGIASCANTSISRSNQGC
jgi:hypothetical protein